MVPVTSFAAVAWRGAVAFSPKGVWANPMGLRESSTALPSHAHGRARSRFHAASCRAVRRHEEEEAFAVRLHTTRRLHPASRAH